LYVNGVRALQCIISSQKLSKDMKLLYVTIFLDSSQVIIPLLVSTYAYMLEVCEDVTCKYACSSFHSFPDSQGFGSESSLLLILMMHNSK